MAIAQVGALCCRLPLPPAVPALRPSAPCKGIVPSCPTPSPCPPRPQVVDPYDGRPLQLRVGIHSGPAVSGVVGRMRRQYSVFGDTVVSGALTANSMGMEVGLGGYCCAASA